jgi:flagellar protein FliO/FliZ
MDWMGLLRAVFALAIVLGLILALAWVLRRYAPQLLARLQAPRGRQRLQVVETLVLDPARRLVLVRLDDEERLILLGDGRELIEPRTKTKPSAPPASPEPAAETPRARLSPRAPLKTQDANDDLF